jgi:hypothetical protein
MKGREFHLSNVTLIGLEPNEQPLMILCVIVRVERDATDKARKLHSANFGFDRTAQKTN